MTTLAIQEQLATAAVRILREPRRHAPAATAWAIRQANRFAVVASEAAREAREREQVVRGFDMQMAPCFSLGELCLGATEWH